MLYGRTGTAAGQRGRHAVVMHCFFRGETGRWCVRCVTSAPNDAVGGVLSPIRDWLRCGGQQPHLLVVGHACEGGGCNEITATIFTGRKSIRG